jgi:uncharacterized protein YukJ
MPLKKYGVLKGTALGHLRDADDDHYQILIKAGATMYRIAVNVKSAAKNALPFSCSRPRHPCPRNLRPGSARLITAT